MKIYLAATAPGNEDRHKHGFLLLRRRLLSYYLIRKNLFESGTVFKKIKEWAQ